MEKQRSQRQNRALHLFFTQLAEELNDNNLDMRKVLKPGIEIPWTPQTVKEFLWRPVQQIQLAKKSTTELTTIEIDEIFNTITKHLGEKFGIFVDFPSIETLIRKESGIGRHTIEN